MRNVVADGRGRFLDMRTGPTLQPVDPEFTVSRRPSGRHRKDLGPQRSCSAWSYSAALKVGQYVI